MKIQESIDIAVELGFSKPSVSVAMKQLRENGYVEMTDGNFLLLTDKGREIAQRMYERVGFREVRRRRSDGFSGEFIDYEYS